MYKKKEEETEKLSYRGVAHDLIKEILTKSINSQQDIKLKSYRIFNTHTANSRSNRIIEILHY